jgi:hypothetical protein
MIKGLFGSGARLGLEEHPSDEELISLLDAELEFRKFCVVNAHWKRCWFCRARLEKLERSIASYMECRNVVMQRNIPLPPQGWRAFDLRLKRAAEELDKGTTKRQVHRFLRCAAGAFALFAVAVVLWTSPARAAWTRQFVRSLSSFLGRSNYAPDIGIRPVPRPIAKSWSLTPLRGARIAAPKLQPKHKTAAVVLPPAPEELDAAELQARFALHQLGGCLGEQVACVRDGDFIVLRGLVETADRKAAISAALQPIPHTKIEIRSFEEALTAEQQSSATASGPPRVERVPDSRKPFADRLRILSKPRSTEELLTRSRNAVQLADEALRHAWALRRLADNYPPERSSRLSADLQRLLGVMASDHAAQLQSVLAKYRENLDALLFVSAADVPPVAGASVPRLFMDVQKMERLTRSVFADSDDEPSDPQASVAALLDVLSASLHQLDDPAAFARIFSNGRTVATDR